MTAATYIMDADYSTQLPLITFAFATILAFIALQTSHRLFQTSLLLPIYYLGISSFNGVTNVTSDLSIRSALGLFVLIWLLHITCMILEDYGSKQEQVKPPRTYLATYKMLFNPRRINKSNNAVHQNGDTKQPGSHQRPGAESINSQKPNAAPPAGFPQRLFWALALLAAYHTHQNLITSAFTTILPRTTTPLHTQATYIRRLPTAIATVTLPETALRALTVIDFVLSTYIVDNLFHTAFSLLSIDILRLDTPDEWPPLFGSIRHTTSVRNFWAKFWHRLVAPTFTSVAGFVLGILRIKSRSVAGRILMVCVVFGLSGVAHGMTTWAVGMRCGWWEDVWWFGMQVLAMQVEEVAGRVGGVIGAGKMMRAWPGLSRVVGHIWTWGFMFWSLPKMMFRKMECGVR
ncbi:hypothetical protein PMZ80_004390 [Knufia obscura]|uniref:Wax synthase domain-containing protein n=1 Tax=Knufia obscura TaxID=1635080 RepID=A0ABR0RT10_9EURO|nr:hypothetical protein PMZ80_004390 [Knufia obscura]